MRGMAVGRIRRGLAPERDGGESEPADLGDRERLPVHGHSMPFDAAIVLEHAKQWITPGEVLVHHAGAVDLERAAVLAQHHEARRMIDLGIKSLDNEHGCSPISVCPPEYRPEQRPGPSIDSNRPDPPPIPPPIRFSR